MDRVEYEALLNEIYDGKVKAKNQYINPNAVLFHKCLKCNERFYGKPKFMVGSDFQRHLCGFPYGVNGERTMTVRGGRDNGTIKGNKKSKKSVDVWKRFYEMIWEDYTFQQIAKELQVNPDVIQDYFRTEGLI